MTRKEKCALGVGACVLIAAGAPDPLISIIFAAVAGLLVRAGELWEA